MAIFLAKSETEIVSGTNTSCTTGSVGAVKACSTSSSLPLRPLFLPLGDLQPLPTGAAPRVFSPRLRFSSSFQSLLLPLPFLLSLLPDDLAPSLAAGLCKVPSLRFLAFSFAAASASSLRLFSSSARRLIRSSFLRKSSC